MASKRVAPKLNSKLIDKKTPQILSLAASRAGQWVQHSWKWLHGFRGALLKRVELQERTSTRTMRIDQRIAIYQLLQIILSHLDLKTMQVGFYHQETQTFIHLSVAYLARKSQLSERRTQRALRWLQQSGYISAFRQSTYDEMTDEYIYKPSVRRVHPKLMFELGITPRALNKARVRSAQNHKNAINTKRIEENLAVGWPSPRQIKKSFKDLIPLHAINAQQKNPKPPPNTYYEKIQKLMLMFPNISLEEAKNMLPQQ